MSDPARELIAQALKARLELITKAAGYQTDAGLHVFRRRRPVMEWLAADLPCLVLFSGERAAAERLTGQGGTHHMGTVDFVVVGYVESEEPDREVNLLEADILKAVLGDETLATTGVVFPAGTVVEVVETGSVTDYAEFADRKRGFVQQHFDVLYQWTHSSP